MDWRALVAVGFGGGVGSVMRYLVTLAVMQRTGPGFPWATLGINLVGSFAIGIVAELAIARATGLSPVMRLFLMTGILGGFTTFSAFSLDLVILMGDRAEMAALVYAAVSVLGGFIAAYFGIALVRALASSAAGFTT